MKLILSIIFCWLLQVSCDVNDSSTSRSPADSLKTEQSFQPQLPEPVIDNSIVNFSEVTGWPEGRTPVAPEGFTVKKFASNLVNPRYLFVAPNGDVFVSEATSELKGAKKAEAKLTGRAASQNINESPNRIILLRDADQDGVAETKHVYLKNLNQPYGILIREARFYVANTDGLLQYPYNPSDSIQRGTPNKILPLPAGGYNNHWTRNVIASGKGDKLYVAVGSGSNIAENGLENEIRRAAILEINPDGSGERIYANGLRNPVGLDLEPGSNQLWTTVNERDGLGDELVPDYLTGVKEGGFYGWPYSYWGQREDPRLKDKQEPDLVKLAIIPDYSLGAHTASLGIKFYTGASFPESYKGGAFISQHGSWNRSKLSGYKIIFVPFKNGRPAGEAQDFLTGFVVEPGKSKVFGRPVGLAILPDGSLLVADDAANTIWRVQYKK